MSNIRGVLDDLKGLTIQVQDRIVGSLNPYLSSAFANALVLGGIVLAAIQFRPEFFVGGALPVGFVHEHAVVPAFDLLERVTEGFEEVLIGSNDGSIHVELDHRLSFADGSNLAFVIGGGQRAFADVLQYVDDFIRTPVSPEDRRVRVLDPNLFPTLSSSPAFAITGLAPTEFFPKCYGFCLILRSLSGSLIHENAYVSANQLGSAEADKSLELFIDL